MPNYGNSHYWDKRYLRNKDQIFDWLEDYQSLKPYLDKCGSRGGNFLNLGCGNSQLAFDMFDDGYLKNFNIDISSVVIEQMKEKTDSRPMQFEVMDVRDLKFETGFFDLIVDKSTIDALLCGNNSFYNVALMMKEVQRVLRVGGYYVAVSYGLPESRLQHFVREHLQFEIEHFPIVQVESDSLKQPEMLHYIYVCKKCEGADEKG